MALFLNHGKIRLGGRQLILQQSDPGKGQIDGFGHDGGSGVFLFQKFVAPEAVHLVVVPGEFLHFAEFQPGSRLVGVGLDLGRSQPFTVNPAVPLA